MKTLTKLVLYSVPALLLAAPLAAQHGPGFGRGFGSRLGPGPEGHFGRGFLAGRIAERLDLSEAQQQQIHAIHENYQEETEGLMETMRVARLGLQEQIHAELFDETAIREAAGRVAAVEADLAVMRARIASDVHQVLTPEQLVEAQALREHMREHAGEWRGRGRGHRGRGGFGGPPVDGD